MLESGSRSAAGRGCARSASIFFLALAVAEAEAAMRAEMREEQVLLAPRGRARCSAAPILGDESEPARIASTGFVGIERLAADADLAAARGPQAEDRLDRLGAPGADQAAEAEDLAFANCEGDVAHHRRRAQALHVEQRSARRAPTSRAPVSR